jgi:hypothetical protein
MSRLGEATGPQPQTRGSDPSSETSVRGVSPRRLTHTSAASGGRAGPPHCSICSVAAPVAGRNSFGARSLRSIVFRRRRHIPRGICITIAWDNWSEKTVRAAWDRSPGNPWDSRARFPRPPRFPNSLATTPYQPRGLQHPLLCRFMCRKGPFKSGIGWSPPWQIPQSVKNLRN